MGIDCEEVGAGGGSVGPKSKDSRFTWVLTFEDEDVDQLLRKKAVTKNAYVGLVEKESERKLWPVFLSRENEVFNVTLDHNKNQMKVSLNKLTDEADAGRGRTMMALESSREITCGIGRMLMGRASKDMIYQGVMAKDLYNLWTSTESVPLRVTVSLGGCEDVAVKKQAECSLKVVTGSDLKN